MKTNRRIILSIIVFLATLTGIAEAGNNKWTSGGPYGGVFSDFAFNSKNANLIFALGNWTFRSRNAGLTWEALQFSASVIRSHPGNPGTIYAVAGCVFTSTDEGNSWKQLSCLPEGLQEIEFHPNDPAIIYGVSHTRGVYKSTDAGNTWVEKNNGLDAQPADGCCYSASLEINPLDPKILFASLPSRKIFKSTDGGESWQNASTGLDLNSNSIQELVLDRKNPQVLYAVRWPWLYKTTNGGTSWLKIIESYFHGFGIDPKNSNVLYGAQAGLNFFKSIDGGKTFSQTVAPFHMFGLGIHPTISNLLFVGGYGLGVARSKDGGKQFQIVNNKLDAAWIESIALGRKGEVVAVAEPNLHRSSNSGTSWRLSDLPTDGLTDLGIYTVDGNPRKPNLMVASGEGNIVISTDGGKTWDKQEYRGAGGNLSLGNCRGRCLQFSPSDDSIYVASVLSAGSPSPIDNTNQGIAVSKDLGKTWKILSSGMTDRDLTAMAIDPRNASRIYVGTRKGKIFRTTNGGNNWKAAIKGLSGAMVSSIAVHPSNSNIVYSMTQSGFFKSTDGGTTWALKNRELSGDRPISVDFNNPGLVFAGGYGSPFVSHNESEDWSVFDSRGLGPFFTGLVYPNPWIQDTYLLATQRGVFSYTLAGAPGGPRIRVLSPAVATVGTDVVIAGDGFGTAQGSTVISFSGGSPSIKSWTDTEVRVTITSGMRSGPVTITVAGKKSNEIEFAVLPANGKLDPVSGPASGGTRTTIVGPSGLAGTQFQLLFGSAPAKDIRFVEPNIIICTTPPGNGTVPVTISTSALVSPIGEFQYQ